MEPKQKLGYYEIQSRLGAGGMGEVYLARDTRLSRLVAIKTLLPSFAADQERLKRFLQEARVTSSLNHPNIGHLYEIGEDGGVWYLALEYIDGPTIGMRLQSGPIPVPELLDLALQAADALAEAHAQGVLHRDLKPDNLMIDRRGQLKLLDFGLARATTVAESATDETRTQMVFTDPGVVMGTPRYMSPEQALGRPLDARSDLFSMGVVLYQMATGVIPFDGRNRPELTDAILHHTPAAPVRLNPAIPAEFERILSRLMEKDPALRYQTASDLRADLMRLKRDSESGRQAPSPAPATRNVLWIGLTVAALAIAGGAFLWFRPLPSAVTEPAGEMNVQSILNSLTMEIQPAISADGKSVAFAWNSEGGDNFDIYVKLIDAGNPLRLTNTPDPELWPKWSPDGRYVAFVRRTETQAMLLIVPALGGGERLLFRWHLLPQEREFGPNFNWHPDGKHIAYAVPAIGNEPAGLHLLDLDSGTATRLTTVPPGKAYDQNPEFFSSGMKLAFIRMQSAASGSVEVLSLTDKTTRSYPVDGQVLAIAIAPGEKNLLLTMNGPMQLQRLRLDTGAVTPSEPLLRPVQFPSISADGRRMLFQQATRDNNIWHATLDRPGHASSPVQWIASTFPDVDPRYSANGDQILFTSMRGGNRLPWISDRQGRNPLMIPINGPFHGSPRWSPDSGRIAYDARIQSYAQVMVVSSMGGTPKQITTDNFENVVPSWSHDGQWIYYCSNRSGRQEIWRIRPDGGASEQVTRNGGFDSQESRDGKYLYYSRSRIQPTVLCRRTPEGAEEMLVPEARGRVWVAGNEGVYFLKAKDLMYLDLATRKIVKVLSATNGFDLATRSIDLSPDGRELLWSQIDSYSYDIALVENFR